MATFGSFVSGQTLTAAELNTAGEWSSYTPTWTQSATITKTVNWARYTQLNKLVIGSIKMTATSAGTSGNKMLVSFPANASSNNWIIGTMQYIDINFNDFNGSNLFPVFYDSAGYMSFGPGFNIAGSAKTTTVAAIGRNTPTSSVRFGQNFTNVDGGSVTGITAASDDVIFIQFMYEAA